jgi:hypothetical protein
MTQPTLNNLSVTEDEPRFGPMAHVLGGELAKAQLEALMHYARSLAATRSRGQVE